MPSNMEVKEEDIMQLDSHIINQNVSIAYQTIMGNQSAEIPLQPYGKTIMKDQSPRYKFYPADILERRKGSKHNMLGYHDYQLKHTFIFKYRRPNTTGQLYSCDGCIKLNTRTVHIKVVNGNFVGHPRLLPHVCITSENNDFVQKTDAPDSLKLKNVNFQSMEASKKPNKINKIVKTLWQRMATEEECKNNNCDSTKKMKKRCMHRVLDDVNGDEELFEAELELSKQGVRNLLLYRCPDTNILYRFYFIQSSNKYDIYRCSACGSKNKYTPIRARGNQFVGDPSKLDHSCNNMMQIPNKEELYDVIFNERTKNGMYDILHYVSSTGHNYRFSIMKNYGIYQRYKCTSCILKKKYVSIMVWQNKFVGDPSKLGHICAMEDKVTHDIE